MESVKRVLVVDDSAYVRKTVKQMLSKSPFLEVVGTAADGEEALELVKTLQPDVVTLDLIMPNMDGVEFLKRQMAICPVPVVIVSIASESGAMALAALDAGAIDFIQKPTALATDKIYEIGRDLIEKVKTAASIPLARLKGPLPLPPKPAVLTGSLLPHGKIDIVVIGISTGGPQALKYFIPQLPQDLPVPVAVVLHMPVGYTEMYAKSLDTLSPLTVVEAADGQTVLPGTVLIAPAGRHLKFRRNRNGEVYTHLDAQPFDTPHRPAVDVLFQSAAEVYGAKVLGVVMSGMGSDGKLGAAWIKTEGGTVFTEAEESCIVYGMPRSVVEEGLSDRVVSLERMAQAILETI